MKRRNFLQSLAAIGIGIPLAKALPAQEEEVSHEAVKIVDMRTGEFPVIKNEEHIILWKDDEQILFGTSPTIEFTRPEKIDITTREYFLEHGEREYMETRQAPPIIKFLHKIRRNHLQDLQVAFESDSPFRFTVYNNTGELIASGEHLLISEVSGKIFGNEVTARVSGAIMWIDNDIT